MTVKEMRAEAKRRGLKGYSKLRKAELAKLLEGACQAGDFVCSKKSTRGETVASLKARCKELGLVNYSRLRKAELQAIAAPFAPKPVSDEQVLCAKLGTMAATLDESRAMVRLMRGAATTGDKAAIDARRLRAIAELREEQETENGWKRWHARLVRETGNSVFAGV